MPQKQITLLPGGASVPSSPTRRSFLMNTAVSVASVASAVAVAAPSIAAAAADRHDAELINLAGELKAAHAAMVAAMNRCDEKNQRLNALQPAKIELPQPPSEHRHLWENATGGAIDLLTSVVPDHPFILWLRESEPQREAVNAANLAAHMKAYNESGYPEVQAEFDNLHDEMMAIFDEIMDTPAQSVVGMRVKVDAVYLMELQDDPGNAWDSIAEDVRALSGPIDETTVRVASARRAQATKSDPIFAAIDEHRGAWLAFERAVRAECKAQEKWRDERGTIDCSIRPWKNAERKDLSFLNLKDLKAIRAARIRTVSEIDRIMPAKKHSKANRKLRAMLSETKRAYKKVFKPIESAREAASDAAVTALWTLRSTTPASAAGAVAALGYIREHYRMWKRSDLFEGDEMRTFLTCLEEGVAKFARLPAPEIDRKYSVEIDYDAAESAAA